MLAKDQAEDHAIFRRVYTIRVVMSYYAPTTSSWNLRKFDGPVVVLISTRSRHCILLYHRHSMCQSHRVCDTASVEAVSQLLCVSVANHMMGLECGRLLDDTDRREVDASILDWQLLALSRMKLKDGAKPPARFVASRHRSPEGS